MIGRLTRLFVLACVILCFLCPVFLIAAYAAAPLRITHRSSTDSIGIVLEQDGVCVLKKWGFGPGRDSDTEIHLPSLFGLASVVPVLWIFANRPLNRLDRGDRRLFRFCVAAPIVTWIALIGASNREATVLVAIVSFTFVVVLGLLIGVKHLGRPSLVERRILHGLCPNCGYDMRATRDRCPECGVPWPAANSPR